MYKAINNIREQKGFTLIELLIVVAIIGILAAIAVPAFMGQQKKAKWRALQASCDGASKQAATFLNDLAKLDPIVLLLNPSTKVCFAHFGKVQVDTDADGIVDTATCAAKFADFPDGNTGTYNSANPSPTLITDLANSIAAEACGGLGVANLDGLVATIAAPFAGQNKTSPYREDRCVFQVVNAFVADANSGQCIMIPNNNARTIQLVAIEDKGNNTDGETKSWMATAE